MRGTVRDSKRLCNTKYGNFFRTKFPTVTIVSMGTTTDCANDCGRPTPDTCYICPDCGTALHRLLASILDEVTPGATGPRADLNGGIGPIGPDRVIPGLASSLDVAITKQARFTQLPGGTPATRPAADDVHTVLAEQPLPFGYAASEARGVLASTLATWTALIAEQRGLNHPIYTLPDLAVFLLDQVQWLRQQPAGADAFDELTAAIRDATRAIDRPAARVYAGPCVPTDPEHQHHGVLRDPSVHCPGHLYAREGSSIATCDACARDMDLDTARDPLLARIDDMVLTGREIELALGGLGSPVKAKTISKWRERGRIISRGQIGTQHCYRVRDVRLLATT